MEKYRAQNQARFEQIAPRIREQYHVTDKYDILDIDRAEKEIAQCDNCTGDLCKKKTNQYFRPVIRFTQWGLSIAQAPCPAGELRILQRQCGRAQIPRKYVGKSFNDYQQTEDNQRAIQLAKLFCQKKPSQGLYLFGECGTGKTFLAAIIAQEFLREFVPVIFGDLPALLADLKATFDKGGTEALLDRYCNCDLLILDDLSAGQVTEWTVGVIYQIVNSRYNNQKPTVITSNYDLRGLEEILSRKDSVAGKRITSRLREMSFQCFLGTKDRRI